MLDILKGILKLAGCKDIEVEDSSVTFTILDGVPCSYTLLTGEAAEGLKKLMKEIKAEHEKNG